MTSRSLVIPYPVLLIIATALFVYVAIAEAFEFYLFTWPGPGESTIDIRLEECAVLWTMLCSAALWFRVWRIRTPSHDAISWPLALVPLCVGVWFAAHTTWRDWYSFFDPMMGWFYIMGPVSSLIMGAIGSAMLWGQIYTMRRIQLSGVCLVCGYDLRGITSNRCPECGLQIDENGTARSSVSPQWCPEILLFDTARQRDEACKSARRECSNFFGFYLPVLLALGLIFASDFVEKQLKWVLMITSGIVSFVTVWVAHRKERCLLRQYLCNAGIPVCLKCGHDLRGVNEPVCPSCSADITGPGR